MPYGDGTGPTGFGPMTGRAAGFCAGYSVPGYTNPVFGRGFFGRGRGMGLGRGRGWRNMFYKTGLPEVFRNNQLTPQMELEALKKQAEYMQNEIKAVNDRINELEKL